MGADFDALPAQGSNDMGIGHTEKIVSVGPNACGVCALIPDKTTVAYVPAGPGAGTLPGAESVTLSFVASDKRVQYGDRISTKKNGYGMEMARIVSTNDVVELTRIALQQEFKALGFNIGTGGLVIGVELQTFYTDFKSGFLSGTAVAQVGFTLRIKDVAGTLVYVQIYNATGTVDGVHLASGENAKLAVEKALANAVKDAISDKALLQALLSAKAKSAGAPVRGASRGESGRGLVFNPVMVTSIIRLELASIST